MAKPHNPDRVAARLIGERFYEGPPCRRGHTTKYTRTAQCVACSKERSSASAARNAEARRQYQRDWYDRNRESVKARSAAWRAANPEQFKATLRNWIAENPEKYRANCKLQRSRRRGAPGRFTVGQVRLIREVQNGRCAYCGLSEGLHLDHMTPVIRGGVNWPWNLQWLCGWHNMSKGSLTDAEYRERIGLPTVDPMAHPFRALLICVIFV